MANGDLLLKDFTAESFLGIDSGSPVVVEFEAHQKQGVTVLKGDQGTGKTSTLTALMYMMGAAFDIDIKNFNNLKDETTKADLPFTWNGSNYHAILSGGRLTLKKQYKEAGGKWIAEGSPKEMLRIIFGNLGVSPMFLKSMDGKKQIEWFKKTFGKDEDAGRKEKKIVTDLQKVTDDRKTSNREIKAVKGWLDVNELYSDYEKSEKKFEKPINADKEKKKFEELSEKRNAYNQYQNTLAIAEGDLKNADNAIADLEKRLQAEKDKKAKLSESVDKGRKWLDTNKGIVKEYEDAQKTWMNLSKTLVEYKTWQEVLDKEKVYNELLEKNIHENADIDKFRTDLLKLTKTYLPDIAGLEVRVKVSLEDEDEGLYYQGKTLAQLSESELWNLFIQIWEDNEVRFIFCENIQDLGSEAIKTMNRLVKEKKARIFASEMQRGKKEMEVTFETKIE